LRIILQAIKHVIKKKDIKCKIVCKMLRNVFL
jgi:hypothetical protein